MNPTSPAFLRRSFVRWVEELTDLVAAHGFATFILATDDQNMIETFAGRRTASARSNPNAEVDHD